MSKQINNSKSLIVLSSPSGGGKSTVAKFLLSHYQKLRFSISATTRKIRPGESNGKDYFFLSKEDFKSKIEQNELIEYEEIFGNYYGTLRSEIDIALSYGEYLLFDVDVKGAVSLQKAYPDDCLLLFISPPDLSILEERLRLRNTESEEQVKIRLSRAAEEMEFAGKFHYHIINDLLNKTLDEVKKIIDNETGLEFK